MAEDGTGTDEAAAAAAAAAGGGDDAAAAAAAAAAAGDAGAGLAGGEGAAGGEADGDAGDGLTGKGGGSNEQKPAGAPEKYETFELPDGIELDKGFMEKGAALFKSLGLSQEQAQQAVTVQAEQQRATLDAWNTQVIGWSEASRKDTELVAPGAFGGALNVVKKYGSEGLTKILTDTGLEHHPEVKRIFVKIAKALGEGGTTPGRKGAEGNKGKSKEEILYGS